MDHCYRQSISVGVVQIILFVLMATSSAQSQVEETLADSIDDRPNRQEERSDEVIAPAPNRQDGPAFRVDTFDLQYARKDSGHPPVEQLLGRTVELGLTPKGFVAPRPDSPIPTATVKLSEVHRLELPVFHASAIRKICENLVDALNDQGLIGVYVEPDPHDIHRTHRRDLRPEGQLALRLSIRTAYVTETRTIASGDRVPTATRVNASEHQRILRSSPLHPDGPGHTGDLLNKDVLDAFLFQLNRHPGRRVDASVAAGSDEEYGGVSLDYLVSENKPWLAYVQVSNTGTDQTNEHRERMGFVHHQLTNNDDIFRVDYITAGFDDAHAVTASYEAPLGDSRRARWRLYGAWSDFTASEIGLSVLGLKSESWLVGGEGVYNIQQHGPLFVDLVGGIRFEHIFVDNRTVSMRGRDDFLLPYVGVRFDRATDHITLAGSLTLEANMPSLAGTDEDDLMRLGRDAVERDFFLIKWNFFGSAYLEPLLAGGAWETAQDVPMHAVLAHELTVSFRGQVAFDDRLVPQFEQIAGGLYSVRGYTEALTSGDNVVIGGIEYRFHLPRMLPVQEDPNQTPLLGEPFRFSPQRRFGQTDWDLVFKAFLDMAHTHHNDSGRSGGIEEDETLIGAGIGLELLVKRNLSVRADWGVALRDAGNVTRGSSQFHFVTMMLY